MVFGVLASERGMSWLQAMLMSAAVYSGSAQLAALQCDEGQGYHMSKPLPAHELPAFVARWRERQAQAVAALS